MNVNSSKLLVALATIVCITVLLAIGRIDDGVGVPVITSVLGYILGNGVTSLRGQVSQPVIGPKS